MWSTSWFRPLRTARHRRTPPCLCRLEILEDRNLLSFLPPVNYPVTSGASSVAVGDFNNDGNLDVATANTNSATVSVLLGNGDGTFQAPASYAAGQYAIFVAAADLNGDGNLDLVVANYFDNTVNVLLGNGDGTFQGAGTYSVGPGPEGVAVADLNGDGIPDLAVSDSPGSAVNVLIGNGDGTFQSGVSYFTDSPASVVAADINGDGALDLVTPNYGAGTVSVLFNNGDGTFGAPVAYATDFNPISVAVADFNGDGAPDLAVANFNGGVPGTLNVLLNNGDGTFASAARYAAGGGPEAVVAADFTGDGVCDLAVANGPGNSVSVFVGNGDGSFQAAQNFAAGNYPFGYIMGVGDFNGDGALDLAVANLDSSDVSILINANDWSSAPRAGNFGAAAPGQPAALAPVAGTTALGAVVRSQVPGDAAASPAGIDVTTQAETKATEPVLLPAGVDALFGGALIDPLTHRPWAWQG